MKETTLLYVVIFTVVLLAKSNSVLGRNIRSSTEAKDPAIAYDHHDTEDYILMANRNLENELLSCDDFGVYSRQYANGSYDFVLVCYKGGYAYDIDTDTDWLKEHVNDILQEEVDLILPENAELMHNDHINLHEGDIQVLAKEPHGERNRQLYHQRIRPLTGNKTVLIVRAMANDTDNLWTEKQLSDAVFDEPPINFASQYYACSYEKLNFIKAEDRQIIEGKDDGGETNISNGATTVRIPYSVNAGTTKVRNAIRDALRENFGVRLWIGQHQYTSTSLANHIMYCYPPGVDPSNGWVADGIIDSWLSVYASDWCTSYTVLMHGIGHNLGLSYSGDDNSINGDQTGVMGWVSYANGPMCFNAAKSWDTGWYEDKVVSLSYSGAETPIETRTYIGRVYGISEYNSIGENEIVLIKLEQLIPAWYDTHPDQYFITFNAARGINSGTQDAINKVTVVSASQAYDVSVGDFYRYEVSSLLAELSDSTCTGNCNQSYTIPDFEKMGYLGIEATITVKNINIDGGYADVEVCIGICPNPECPDDKVPAITNLLFVNAKTDQVDDSITLVSDWKKYPFGPPTARTCDGFNIKAEVSNPEVVSYVKFTKGGADYQTEGREPYAVCGDDDGNYKSCPSSGFWEIVATPYYLNCQGEIVAGAWLPGDVLVICESTPPTPSPTVDQARFSTKVIGFVPMNADTNLPKSLPAFNNSIPVGMTAVPLGYIGHGLNFQVILDGDAGSVVSWLDGVRRTENVHPYALCGDWGGNYFRCPDLCGEIELKAKVCSLRYGRGECSEIVSASVMIECAPPTTGPTPADVA